jgi:hypothetical protein
MWKTLLSQTKIALFHKIHVFLHFIWRGYLSYSEWFSHSDCKYAFHNLTQFSQGSNVLDTPASLTMAFFNWYDASSFHLNGPSCTKWISSHLKNLTGRQKFLQNITQFWQRNIVLDSSASHIDGFLTRETGLLPFTWK